MVFMNEGNRSRLSPAQRTDIWRRWKAGQSLHEIGRAFDKPHNSIRCLLLPRGGIPPAARRRSGLALTLAEREDISRGIAFGWSIRETAKRLNRAASTVSREVTRHGGRSAYRAHDADSQAWESALRPKRCLLTVNGKLRNIVASKLILDGSPEQISGWLKTHYSDDQSMRVSHETIYRSLFIQAQGVLKKELMDHLRSKRRMRRSRHANIRGQSRGQIVDAISIRERPAEIEDRAIPGHWEGDLLSGAKNSYLATLVERHSRFAMLIKVPSKDTEVVVAALSRRVRKLPATLRRFADVGSRSGDGRAQNLHGSHGRQGLLLRSSEPLAARHDRVALRLNQRPRKTIGFETPASRLQASVATK
jgi:IS30 family transposase